MPGVGGADIETAIALFRAGNAAGAAQSCRDELRHNRRNVTALFLLALTQMQERNFEEAERQFAKATELDLRHDARTTPARRLPRRCGTRQMS